MFGSGQFGDLHAVTAAIYLDPEARSSVLDADGIHGRAREPLLKVMHFLRSMELESDEAREVNLSRMQVSELSRTEHLARFRCVIS